MHRIQRMVTGQLSLPVAAVLQPDFANLRAISRPSPFVAPVTNAFWFVKSNVTLPIFFLFLYIL
jgi:hypothetical protein